MAENVVFFDADMLHDGAAYETQDALWCHAHDNTLCYLQHRVEDERELALTGVVSPVTLTAKKALDDWLAHPPLPILRRVYSTAAMQRGVLLATDTIWEMIESDLISDGENRIMIVCGSAKEANAVSERIGQFIHASLIGMYTGETGNKADFGNLESAWGSALSQFCAL